jgi:uncharacterized protein (DUF362 family)
MVDRRRFLHLSAAASVASVASVAALSSGCRRTPQWDANAFAEPSPARTAIIPQAGYEHGLTDAVLRGLRLFPLTVQGRRVLLKPNLVEFDPAGVINTHPALIAATIEAFLVLGAREVLVAEGPGHRRDNEYLLEASGLEYVLRDTGTRYTDLNTAGVRRVPLRSRFTDLGSLYLPEAVLDADLVVSMPKLKTHKWVGVTLSMKNMFGIIPGSVYGWPKNVLHWQGVGQSILDINAALAMPRFNIVDGIIGMEGNGPIQGEARHSGILVFGADSVAVDATCARLMGIDPLQIAYLREAGEFLGSVQEERIEQLGEGVSAFRQDYRVLEHLQHLKYT